MNEFENRVLKTIVENKLISNGDTIVVGFSGGPDSTTLLHILNKINKEGFINFTIIAAHVNHGLRENAKLDEEFVKEYCEKNNIPLEVKHVDLRKIAQAEKRGLEDMGRIVRYAFFEEISSKYDNCSIAIAHNKKDSVETMLMNLFRGSGLVGIRGIEVKEDKYIRPLVNENRKDIEEYIASCGIVPRIDESNSDNTYTRNKIRNVVIPYIEKEFNPNFIDSMTRLSDIVKESDDYINEVAEEVYIQLLLSKSDDEIVINRKEFNKHAVVIKKKVLLNAIHNLCGTTKNIDKVNIEDIIKMCDNNIGNKYLMPNKNIKVELRDKKLYIQKK